MFVAIRLLPFFNYITIRGRDKSGKKKTEKENLKEAFKKEGGIVGYQPIEKKHIALILSVIQKTIMLMLILNM